MFSHKRRSRLARFGRLGELMYHQLFDKPARFIATGFTLTILLGGFLLWLPISQQEGQDVSFIDCLFVATSAGTVTGLSPINIAESYNLLGQIIMMLLIQGRWTWIHDDRARLAQRHGTKNRDSSADHYPRDV